MFKIVSNPGGLFAVWFTRPSLGGEGDFQPSTQLIVGIYVSDPLPDVLFLVLDFCPI